ncbi:hypothetical protein ZWY2020_008389 [Hordeum vulgare]|nr:hypothetical protein ZWY2020_008389 [Hordeum vulgare]
MWRKSGGQRPVVAKQQWYGQKPCGPRALLFGVKQPVRLRSRRGLSKPDSAARLAASGSELLVEKPCSGNRLWADWPSETVCGSGLMRDYCLCGKWRSRLTV